MNRLRAPTRRAKLSFVLAVALVMALAGAALASSYQSTYYFDTTLTGATRSYNGQNIHITFNSHTI